MLSRLLRLLYVFYFKGYVRTMSTKKNNGSTHFYYFFYMVIFWRNPRSKKKITRPSFLYLWNSDYRSMHVNSTENSMWSLQGRRESYIILTLISQDNFCDNIELWGCSRTPLNTKGNFIIYCFQFYIIENRLSFPITIWFQSTWRKSNCFLVRSNCLNSRVISYWN